MGSNPTASAMNYLKPTKIKVVGTFLFYAANLLASQISGRLALVFFPQELVETREKLDISLPVAFGIPVAIFIIEIVILYLSVCLFTYILSKRNAGLA